MDETLRHYRIGDRVEAVIGKKRFAGDIQTFRLVVRDGAEEQLLDVMTEGGVVYRGTPAARCRLLGRAPSVAQPASAGAAKAAPINTAIVARRILASHRGATMVSLEAIRALADDYLALIETMDAIDRAPDRAASLAGAVVAIVNEPEKGVSQ